MRLRIILFTVVILVTQPLFAAQQEDVMTLQQAIAFALENNRTLKNAELEVEKARNQVAAARTRRLPSINTYTLSSRQLSHVCARSHRFPTRRAWKSFGVEISSAQSRFRQCLQLGLFPQKS